MFCWQKPLLVSYRDWFISFCGNCFFELERLGNCGRQHLRQNALSKKVKSEPEREVCPPSFSPYSAHMPCGPGSRRRPEILKQSQKRSWCPLFTCIVIVALLTRKMMTGEMMRTRTRTATPNPCCSFAEFNSFPTIWLMRPCKEYIWGKISAPRVMFGNTNLLWDLKEQDVGPRCIYRLKDRTGMLLLCLGFYSFRFES